MWGGSVAEALCFLAEGRGAVCSHPDPTGCALPVLETPPRLTSCKPRYATRLGGSLSVLVFVSVTATRQEPGAQGGRVDVFQLARVLLALLACRVTPDGFGNVAGEAGMAATGMVLREEEAGCTPRPHGSDCTGSCSGAQLQSIADCSFPPPLLSWQIQPPQARWKHGILPRAPHVHTWSPDVHIHIFKCQFLYFWDLKVPFCPADIYTMFIDYPSERTQQKKLDS